MVGNSSGHRAAAVLGLAATLMPPADDADEFQMWAKLHNKFYPTQAEETLRRSNWMANKKYIETRNSNPDMAHKCSIVLFVVIASSAIEQIWGLFSRRIQEDDAAQKKLGMVAVWINVFEVETGDALKSSSSCCEWTSPSLLCQLG